MIEFYITRHGQTEFNLKKISQGQRLDSPLTKKGIESGKKKANILKNIKFEAIISSDIGRAKKTSKIINKELNLKLRFSKKLREIDYGDYTGIKTKELRKKCPEYKKVAKYIFPRGESYQQVYDRSVLFLKSLEKKHKRILIVTHAGVLRAIISFLNNSEYEKDLDTKLSNDIIIRAKINKGKPTYFEIIQK